MTQLTHRSSWAAADGTLSIVEGTVIRLDIGHLPSGATPKPVWLWWSGTDAATAGTSTGSGRPTCGASTSSTPSACSSRPSAGHVPRSELPRRPTAGPGSSSLSTPSYDWPAPWPPTAATRGRTRVPRTGSLQPASAATFGTSAHTPPARPEHRNPPAPAPDGHQARRTPGPPHATTCTHPAEDTHPSGKRRKQLPHDHAAQVKDQARRGVPPWPVPPHPTPRGHLPRMRRTGPPGRGRPYE